MMKSPLSLILLLAFSANALAYDFMVDGLCYDICSDGDSVIVTYESKGLLSNYDNLKGDIIIPEHVTHKGKSYTVTQIGNGAFQKCFGLISATIPNSVTMIADSAFKECTGLTSLIIPNSVTRIGYGVFEGCTGLTSVIIPNSVTKISHNAFKGCTGLTSVNIPNSVTYVGYGVFEGCTNLTEVNLPNSIPEIGWSFFEGCTSLVSMNIPNSVVEIGWRAFEGCIGLTSVTIPNSVKEIDRSAFESCIALTDVNIPNSVKYIGEYAFKGCIGLTSVTIPNSVTQISYSAFEGCSNLESVNIPNSITQISSSVFEGCAGLSEVNIPNSVTKIDEYAFMGCTSLSSIIIPNSVIEIGWFAFSGCTGLTSLNIPNSVTEIGSGAFEGCTGLTSVTIPNSVTEISAFDGCSGLTSVNIPNSVTEIGGFMGCTSLTSVNIPNSVKVIYGSAFKDCTGLTSINIPKSVTEIGGDAFSGCTGLTSLTIPKSVIRIGDSAFSSCTGLTSVNIPNSVTVIGGGAFSGCTSLTEVTIPNSITEISAFSGCTGLTSVTIPNSVTIIGGGAFSGCTSLTSVVLPESVEYIDWDAFSGCTGLSSVNIPESVTHIGDNAFKNCIGLTSVVLPESVEYIDWNAFKGCTGLTSVKLPDFLMGAIHNGVFYGCIGLTSVNIPYGIISIGENAFRGCTSLTIVNIPESVEEIDNFAFKDCISLTGVNIPESVKEIGTSAFENCINLESIVCEITSPQHISTDITAFMGVMHRKTCNLIVPSGTIASYRSATPWRYFANKTEVSSIASYDIQEESTVEQESLSLEQQFQNYYDDGLYGKAIETGERLLTLAEFASDSAKASIIETLALLCYWEKNYRKAINYYEKYRAIIENIKLNDNLELAWVNNMLGNCCIKTNDYVNAGTYYMNAYNYYSLCDTTRFNYTSIIPKTLSEILKCYIAQGKIQEAIKTYQKIQQYTKDHNHFDRRWAFIDYSQYLPLILKHGDELCNQGRYEDAKNMYADAIGFFQLINGDNDRSEALLNERVCRCYLLMQQYDSAHDYLNKSNEKFKNIEYNSFYDYSDYLGIDRGIDENNRIYLDLANDLKLDSAIYCASQGDFVTSYSSMKEALVYIYTNSIDFLGNNTSAERSAYWEKNSHLFCEVYPYVVAKAADVNNRKLNEIEFYGDLYNKSALFAKGLLLTSDNEFRRTIYESGDSILISRYEELEKLRTSRGSLSDEQRKIVAEEATEIEKELIVVSKGYKEFIDNLQLTWKDVQKNLGAHDIAIEFLSFPKLGSDSTFYIALTVRKDYDRPHRVFLGEEHEFQAAAKKAYTSNELSHLIWGRLSNELKRDEEKDTVKNIYFSPSGILHQVAIESMPHWVNTVSLMNQCYNIYRLSSTRELVIERNSIQSDSAAVYGDIEYSTPVDSMGTPRKVTDESSSNGKRGFDANSAGYRGKEWKELEYSKPEINSITSILESKKIDVYKMAQKDATETSFKDLSKQKKNIIHISTHGFCWNDSTAREKGKNRTKPLSFLGNGQDAMTRSGLLFSGANHCFADGNKKSDSIPEGVDDGVLTAYEASQLDLRDLDLLVLSACETGLGDISAEGVFGLQRGFKKAGARSIIMSLWEVNDLATSEMMTKFYKYWIEYGMSKHEAFLEAQKDIKNKYGNYEYKDGKPIEPTDKPYWAAFILLDALEAEPL